MQDTLVIACCTLLPILCVDAVQASLGWGRRLAATTTLMACCRRLSQYINMLSHNHNMIKCPWLLLHCLLNELPRHLPLLHHLLSQKMPVGRQNHILNNSQLRLRHWHAHYCGSSTRILCSIASFSTQAAEAKMHKAFQCTFRCNGPHYGGSDSAGLHLKVFQCHKHSSGCYSWSRGLWGECGPQHQPEGAALGPALQLWLGAPRPIQPGQTLPLPFYDNYIWWLIVNTDGVGDSTLIEHDIVNAVVIRTNQIQYQHWLTMMAIGAAAL